MNMLILVSHLHVAPTPNVERLMSRQFVPVCLNLWVNLQRVDLNVQFLLNVPPIKHVLTRNVLTHALIRLADKTPNVGYAIIVLSVLVIEDIRVMPSQDVILFHVSSAVLIPMC